MSPQGDGRAVLAVPLVLVNTAAIYGQAGWAYSRITHGGPGGLLIAVLFACAVESIGIYLAWEAHSALLADQASALLRTGSYAIGLLAGLLNYLHFRPDNVSTAVAFGALSAISPWLWAVWSRARNRTRLAELGLVDQRGVKLSTSRKAWHPVKSLRVIRWAAWSGVTDPRSAVTGWEATRPDKAVPAPVMAELVEPDPPVELADDVAPVELASWQALPEPRPELVAHPDCGHLATLISDADKIRWAIERTGADNTSTVCRYLAQRGAHVTSDNVRAVVRRARAAAGSRPNVSAIGAGRRSG